MGNKQTISKNPENLPEHCFIILNNNTSLCRYSRTVHIPKMSWFGIGGKGGCTDYRLRSKTIFKYRSNKDLKLINMGIDDTIEYFKKRFPEHVEVIDIFANFKNREYNMFADDTIVANILCMDGFHGYYYPKHSSIPAEVFICDPMVNIVPELQIK